MQVWNRKELVEEPEVGLGAIRFAYGTAFGRFLAKTILCRKFVSNIYGAWQKSRFSKGKARKFMAQYGITADDCVKTSFDNFNDFFTRQRRPQPDTTAASGRRRFKAFGAADRRKQRFFDQGCALHDGGAA